MDKSTQAKGPEAGDEKGGRSSRRESKRCAAMPEWLAWVLLPLVRGRAPFFAICTSLPLHSGMPILNSTGGKVVQRPVLYLGEINDSQRDAWCRVIEAWVSIAVEAEVVTALAQAAESGRGFV